MVGAAAVDVNGFNDDGEVSAGLFLAERGPDTPIIFASVFASRVAEMANAVASLFLIDGAAFDEVAGAAAGDVDLPCK